MARRVPHAPDITGTPRTRPPAVTHAFSANVFTGATSVVIAFQLALVAGAPWGAVTQGGRVAGTLPAGARAVALLSAAVLAGFIMIVRARAAPATRFPRAIWGVVIYCVLGMVANAATPSDAERAIWLPVVTVMCLTSWHVARQPRRAAVNTERLRTIGDSEADETLPTDRRSAGAREQ